MQVVFFFFLYVNTLKQLYHIRRSKAQFDLVLHFYTVYEFLNLFKHLKMSSYIRIHFQINFIENKHTHTQTREFI